MNNVSNVNNIKLIHKITKETNSKKLKWKIIPL